MVAPRVTSEQVQALLASGREDLVRKLHAYLKANPVATFRPRPDVPEEFDEQTGFIESKATFSIAVGGNGSGKTVCAAVKTAKHVLENPPPRENCPFWILGETFEQTCATCWTQNLAQFIPRHMILTIDWYKPKRNWPRAVVLKHPTKKDAPGWVITFKSYDQGALLMQGQSIGGYWFNEEPPLEIVREVQVRCRDYDSPGWADFTPAHMRDPSWPELYEDPPEGWRFFRMNTAKNTAKKVQQWASKYFTSIPEDERETRMTGAFAGFSGQVFKEFYRPVHVIDQKTKEPFLRRIAEQLEQHKLPNGWNFLRAIDFGYSNPLACLWIARDTDNRYYVFDEHYAAQKMIREHAKAIESRPWKYGHPCYGPTWCDNNDPEGIRELNEAARSPTGAQPYFRKVEKHPNNMGRQISLLRSMMMVQGDGRPRIYILAKCKNLIREIRGYRWQQGASGPNSPNPQDSPVEKDDHTVDAMRYGICHDAMGGRSAPDSVSRGAHERESIRFSAGRS